MAEIETIPIVELPALASITGAEEIPVENTVDTYRITITALRIFINSYITLLTLGVNASAAELNILDGVTASTAELNILDGVTATAAEINILDGVTSSTAELNILDGVTASTAELNFVDGVTSSIQTQLDGKATTAQGVKADSAMQPTLFDAHTILTANTDNTPAALTIAEQTLIGRITGGNIDDLSPAQVRTLLSLVVGTDVQAANAVLNEFTSTQQVTYESNVLISSAELLALHTTGKTLVPAQGAGKIIIPVSITLRYNFVTAAYAGIAAGDDLAVYYNNGAGSFITGFETTGLLDSVATIYAHTDVYAPALSAIKPQVNVPLVMFLLGAITTGDSTVSVKTLYRVIDTSTFS